MKLSKTMSVAGIVVALITAALIIPQKDSIPVDGASKADYNPKSFWYYPWGRSITHKGIDIFAKEGTIVRSSSSGFVIFSGQIDVGGNVVLILGPHGRLHYYAHLKEARIRTFSWAAKNKIIGSVGSSGNAAGKPPHLHYSVVTLIPYPWRLDTSKQGWKKMFYLNPVDCFVR
jgi:peptidoglycan LD-endopeptidase LytH